MSNAVEPDGAPYPDANANFRRERLSFGSFTFTRSPAGRCAVQVELEYDGKRYVGRQEGQSSPIGDLRLGAEAALQAVEAFAQGGLGLELMGVKLVRAFDSNVIIVSCTQRSAGGTRLVGCYLADRDSVRGAALAVLNATNRVLGNYLTTR
ncbi:MAG: hypothetical protein WD801_11905 [Gemmatimonadaceae bacterium]